MRLPIANPERLAAETLTRVIAPPPPVDYLRWAVNNVVFSRRESDFPGPYNPTLFPYFSEALSALAPDDPCRIVTIMASAQVGKTVVGNIFLGGSMHMDPCDFLVVHPTEETAGRWSKTKLAPMLRGTTALAQLFPQKSRDTADSILFKERRDGLGAILISGANSPASLSGVTMRRQVQDDLAKWEMNVAGDPEAQADSRSRSAEFAKILKISTPLVMPGCRITKSFEAGSQEHPYVACPHCRHRQVLEWENMLAHLDPDHPEKACFYCVGCGVAIEEHHRPRLLASLEWRAHNPAAKRFHRSFWIWSAYSYLQSWERIAREWLRAKGDPAAEQTFLNDTCGKAYRAQGEAVSWEILRDRGANSDYARGEIPRGALVVCLGIDCQGDRVEWQVVAFGREHRRWVIDCGIVPGHISDVVCQERLDALLKQTWRNTAGRQIGLDMSAIDGNAYTEDVWEWARRHPASKLIMVRGVAPDSAPLLARVKRERNRTTGKLLKYSSRFYNFGTSVLKMALYRNTAKSDPLAPGYIGFPRGLEDEFYREFTAERREPFKRHGYTVYRWKKDDNVDNEALDTHLQAEAAAIKFGIRGLPDAIWDKLEAEREAPPEAPQGDIEDLLRVSSQPPAGKLQPVAGVSLADLARLATR